MPLHTCRCDDTRGCVMQFWPPDDEHMCSKHVEAWNKLIVKQKFCASSWLITEINILRCTVCKTSTKKKSSTCFEQIIVYHQEVIPVHAVYSILPRWFVDKLKLCVTFNDTVHIDNSHNFNVNIISAWGPGSSVGIATDLPGWMVRDRIPVGVRYSARPDRPWGPPSLL